MLLERLRWFVIIRSQLHNRSSSFENRFLQRCAVYVNLVTLNLTLRVKLSATSVARKFEEEVPAQVSSLSSDHGSKLQVRPKIALTMLENGKSI
ncbi:hypothetical protein AVEN_199844-1 [Araneus ventricosus]|uniref:Uncharacterized protein n=1 Tax=Araneus ventricosus TaxID=182803 RepID=A0A4Y2DS39_ARAVE|nr:hypothetical protein AVEN_199844-1 [Araneus ventricosus]